MLHEILLYTKCGRLFKLGAVQEVEKSKEACRIEQNSKETGSFTFANLKIFY